MVLGTEVAIFIYRINWILYVINMENIDINGLDIKTLRLLLAIADQGSVSKAAEARAMTQSTASYGLDKLRAAFKDPLFVRAGQGMTVTARGSHIVEGCRDFLAALDTLSLDDRFDPAETDRDFVISAAAYEVETILVPSRRMLARDAPGARLVVRGLDLRQVTGQLDSDVDLALLATPTDSPILKRRLLFEDDYVTFFDPTARKAPRSITSFSAAPHAMATLGGKTSSQIDTALTAQGFRRRVALTVSSLESLPSMMRGSDLITTLPRRIGQGLMRDFAQASCPLELPRLSIYALWHARKDTDAGHRWLRGQIYRAATMKP